MSDVYFNMKESFTDTHELDVILQGGEIQQVSKEVIRRATLFNDMSSLMAKCTYPIILPIGYEVGLLHISTYTGS